MPSPLYIQLQQFKQSFRTQWDDHARQSLTEILSSTPFAVFSSIFVASLMIQLLTGLMLSMHFTPSSAQLTNEKGQPLTIKIATSYTIDAEGDTLAMPGDVLYPSAQSDDTIPTRSYTSVVHISSNTSLKFCKTIHAFNTHVLLASIILILLFFGIHVKDIRYFKGMWSILIMSGLLLFALAWIGYILPWDVYSATSYLIFQGILEQGIGVQLGSPTDLIARYFSLHSMILPSLLLFLLSRFQRYFTPNANFNNSTVYGFILIMLITGYALNNTASILPPADAMMPQTSTIEPYWFFQPIHGVISHLPADLAFSICAAAMLSLLLFPFLQSYRMRITLIGMMLILSFLSAIFY